MGMTLIIIAVALFVSALILAPFMLSSRISKDDEELRDIPREIPADSERANTPSTPPPPEVEIKLEVLRARAKPKHARTISGVTVKDGVGKGSDKRTGTDDDPFMH